jgi:Fe-S oxidoreductase
MTLFNKIFKGNTLYYPGCVTKTVLSQIEKNYQSILGKLKIDFLTLKEKEYCCGSPLKNAGYFEEFERVGFENEKLFKEHSIKRIITNCPGCFMTLKSTHSNLKVEHISQTLFNYFQRNNPSKTTNQEVIYHDPCHLGRQGGVYEAPREVLKKIGYSIKEMPYSKKDSLCCGAGGGVQSNYPELANKIAEERLSLLKDYRSKILVSPCPMCYLHFKKNAPKNFQVVEFSELILPFL